MINTLELTFDEIKINDVFCFDILIIEEIIDKFKEMSRVNQKYW